MPVFLINDSTKALDLSKIEYLDIDKREVRFVSGHKHTLSDQDFTAVLDTLKGAANGRI